MSLFGVIPQLRARGFQIYLGGLYPFWMEAHDEMYKDSCGVFLIDQAFVYVTIVRFTNTSS